eukprot:748087-Hanusia_phi.AAC.2
MQPAIEGIRNQKDESLGRVRYILQEYQESFIADTQSDKAKFDELRYRIDSLISRHEEFQSAADVQLLQVDGWTDRSFQHYDDVQSNENLKIAQFDEMVSSETASQVEKFKFEIRAIYDKLVESVNKTRLDTTDESWLPETQGASPGVNPPVQPQRSAEHIEPAAELVSERCGELEEKIKAMEEQNRNAHKKCQILETIKDSLLTQMEESWQKHTTVIKLLLSLQEGELDQATEKLLEEMHGLQMESTAKDSLIAELDRNVKSLREEKEQLEHSNSAMRRRIKSLQAAASFNARLMQELQARKSQAADYRDTTSSLAAKLEPSRSWRSLDKLERNRNSSQSSTTTRDLNFLSALDVGERGFAFTNVH